MKKILAFSIVFFGFFVLGSAQLPERVSPGLTFEVRGQSIAVIDTILYFPGHTGDWDSELWRSDGTEAGTYEVLDLNPSGRAYPHNFVVINDRLFFMADSMSVKEQLFISDGTEAGTEWIADVDDAGMELHHMLTASGDLLYYRTYRPGIYTELWASDGTSAGTGVVINICEEGSSFPHELTDFNGTLIFATVSCGFTWRGLNRTDGTAANTLKISDGYAAGLKTFGDTLYFRATFEDYGSELARSTGIPGSVEMIQDINPGAGGSDLYHLTQVGTKIFFRASHVDYGAELFVYNQNTGVVNLVKDIWPGSSGSSFPDALISYQGKLIFQAHDGVYGQELWISDGTEEGTKMLKNINVEPGGIPYGHSYPRRFYEAAGLLFFSADDGINGTELWQTDGTEEGTVMVHNIGYKYNSSYPGGFTEINGYLYFHAHYNYNSRLYKLKLPDIPVSVKQEPTETPAFEIYPNPAAEELTVKSQLNQSFRYRITDIRGKEVMNGFNKESREYKIDISDLNPGIYFITLENGISRMTNKFVKK
ncbi:Por secretion system C-terminal sorting domain-containing protein [Saccharicrinis carchari]|uniref:Por secretion system C-terminal sorting domain-containing protein n=1 Tax=Saccharicrinis carchari TaxID=1168039 RepID=A0A521BR93_SACCC|nr:ELWxxDGT repeat protein [Saccharicrinis carchari]SMO49629.1 Por secretion system C-terminal sorting domain-containing protein [Saccharicrinis carchari]